MLPSDRVEPMTDQEAKVFRINMGAFLIRRLWDFERGYNSMSDAYRGNAMRGIRGSADYYKHAVSATKQMLHMVGLSSAEREVAYGVAGVNSVGGFEPRRVVQGCDDSGEIPEH